MPDATPVAAGVPVDPSWDLCFLRMLSIRRSTRDIVRIIARGGRITAVLAELLARGQETGRLHIVRAGVTHSRSIGARA